MSRVIKFRAWDGTRVRYDVTGLEHGKGNEMTGVFLDGDFFGDAPLMQFTGLTDSNGVEIYEGDVCCIVQDRRFASKVCFHNGEFTFADYMGGAVINRATQNIEVIGNIYEHRHLLDRSSEQP